MQVTGLVWLGVRTSEHRATVDFFRDVVGLAVVDDPGDFTVLGVPDGSTVEVFGDGSRWNEHLTAPTAGFSVVDLAEAERELRDRGVEIVLPVTGGDERSWLHFRAPDGHVYELVEVHGDTAP